MLTQFFLNLRSWNQRVFGIFVLYYKDAGGCISPESPAGVTDYCI